MSNAVASYLHFMGTALVKLRQTGAIVPSQRFLIGKMIAPIFSPLGIDWRGSVALFSGFVAKEIVVSTMGILYVAEGDKDSEALRTALLSSGMTRLSAISMLVFVLLYLPCLATMAAIRRELRSWKWLLFSIGYSTSLAWVMAFLVFQVGKLLRLGV